MILRLRQVATVLFALAALSLAAHAGAHSADAPGMAHPCAACDVVASSGNDVPVVSAPSAVPAGEPAAAVSPAFRPPFTAAASGRGPPAR